MPGPHFVSSRKGKQKVCECILLGLKDSWGSYHRSTKTGPRPNLFGDCIPRLLNWSPSRVLLIWHKPFRRPRKWRWPGILPQEAKLRRKIQIYIGAEEDSSEGEAASMQFKVVQGPTCTSSATLADGRPERTIYI